LKRNQLLAPSPDQCFRYCSLLPPRPDVPRRLRTFWISLSSSLFATIGLSHRIFLCPFRRSVLPSRDGTFPTRRDGPPLSFMVASRRGSLNIFGLFLASLHLLFPSPLFLFFSSLSRTFFQNLTFKHYLCSTRFQGRFFYT